MFPLPSRAPRPKRAASQSVCVPWQGSSVSSYRQVYKREGRPVVDDDDGDGGSNEEKVRGEKLRRECDETERR